MRSIRGGRRGIDTGRKVVQGTTLLHAPRMGTDAWKNWRAFDSGEPERENYDDELQSDVSFIGGPADFGPFKLSIVIRGVNVGHEVGPALIVHGGVHANLIPEIVINGKLAKADSTAYHGGSMSDEIAALVSLIAGVRLRAAGTVRLSGIHDPDDEDPGTPILFEVPRLSRPGRGDRELIPSAVRRPRTSTAWTAWRISRRSPRTSRSNWSGQRVPTRVGCGGPTRTPTALGCNWLQPWRSPQRPVRSATPQVANTPPWRDVATSVVNPTNCEPSPYRRVRGSLACWHQLMASPAAVTCAASSAVSTKPTRARWAILFRLSNNCSMSRNRRGSSSFNE